MLRLPADLQLRVILSAQAGEACSLTCRALRQTVNLPESILRFYLVSASSSQLPTCLLVYRLLTSKQLRTWRQTEDGAITTIQMMFECAGILKILDQQQQEAAKSVQSATSTTSLKDAVQLLQNELPCAEHCLLPFCAQGGHIHLVKALLPLTHTPVLVNPVLHYVRTSAFLAAAAGGQVGVLSELLSAGASSWACQVSGPSLTRTALDLAAQGGHLEASQLLQQHVDQPSSSFLTAAADSGNGAVMDWALGFWFGQFNAVTPFGPPHVRQMHDALRVACQSGHLSVIRQLLRYLHAARCHDCCVLALSYTCSTSNTESMRCLLESPYLPQQLQRGGPRLLDQLVMVVASCLRIAIRIHSMPSLQLLLDNLSSSVSALAPVRPLLGPQMPSVFDQAATSGNASALQLLLTQLPEHYECLGFSALEAALCEGHERVAQIIRALLLMRGPQNNYTPAALSPEGNPSVARALRQGQLKVASSSGDVERLQGLLQQDHEDGPSESDQLLMLRLAAAAGQTRAVKVLLQEFGGGSRQELCLRAVCRGAVHAGQLATLKSLVDDPSGALLEHLSSQPEALCEYLRAALLCGQVNVAAWLVKVAAQQQQLGLVRATLQSLLTTSRWELWNTGIGKTAHAAVTSLLRVLTDVGPSAALQTEACSTSIQHCHTPAADPTGPDDDRQLAGNAESSAVAATDTLTTEHAAELLTPEVLSLLLHASAGDPLMLYTVVSAVSALGLTSNLQQQQQDQGPRAQPGGKVSAGGVGLTSSESHSSSYATVSSTISGISMEQSTGAQGLCRQVSRICTGGSAILGAQAVSGFAGAGFNPVSPSPGSSKRLPSQSVVSWSTGMLRSAVSDPEALRALGEHVAWREMGLLVGSAIDAELKQLQKQHRGMDVSDDGGGGSSSGGSSSSSSQDRMMLKQLHAAFSEPLGEMLRSPDLRIARGSQQAEMHGSEQSSPMSQTDSCIPQQQQQQQQQVSSCQLSCVSTGQEQDAADLMRQKLSGRSMNGAVRKLQQLTGLVQQLSVSTPCSPQHPYMLHYKQQLQQQPNYLHRASQPGYGCRDRDKQQQCQLRTVVSLPAAKMSQPQHPYMQNYQQLLQQQNSARDGTSGSPV